VRKLVMCRILLAAAALPASASMAQGKGPARGEDLSTQAQDRVESKESSPSTESAPAPPVEVPSATHDDPAPVSEPASAGRSEPPPEKQESSNRETGRTTEPGLSPHYREMEERNQRRYERERRREADKDGGAERHHRGDGGDGKGEHRRGHRHHRYIDGPHDDDFGDFGLDDDSRTGEQIAMPVVGMRFDPEVCSLFTNVSGLLRNMFGNHRCRVLDAARYGLPAPGPGRLWLRVLKDAILVDGSDGRVVDIVRNAVR